MNCQRLISGVLALLAFVMVEGPAAAQSGLSVTYGANGLQTLTYNGVVLENLATRPSDAFHIWHMKATDLSGKLMAAAPYTWGENTTGRAWNAYTSTWTYSFVWGSISLRYAQNRNDLDMIVTTTNNANSGIIFDGATIYPLALNFPRLPAKFASVVYSQYANNTSAPGVTVADYGTGEVAAVAPDATRPLYTGFQPTGAGFGYTAIVSGTSPDKLPAYFPHNDRPVSPGQTDTYTVSLRFASSGTAPGLLAADAYKSWAATYPPVLNWTDRRTLGTVYLASSPSGTNVNQPGGYPTNPRRYFNDSHVDIYTPAGLAAFQNRLLSQAQSNVANLKKLNAQGVIAWDIEGQEYPQNTSYVCSPDQIAQIAPEMESIVSNTASPYFGMKLDDAFFKTMSSAGFRVGVCVRPQHFTFGSGGTAAQVYLPNAAVAAEIIRKMTYAHNRWGATLFYIDSSVDSIGSVLDASIFRQAAAALPDSLLIPEESTPRHYAYTAPLRDFIDRGDLGTDANVYNYYPDAFSPILINDANAGRLAAAQAQITTQVHQGDILMGHAQYWQQNNPVIVQIYKDAGVWTPPNPGLTVTSTALSASSTSTVVGTSITLTANVSPAAATGAVIFYDGSSTLGNSALLNGVAKYATSPLTAGTHSFTAAYGGSSSYAASTSGAVAVTTIPLPPPGKIAILSPAAGATVSGSIVVTGQVNLYLDSSGSYLMVDGKELGTHRVTQKPYLYPLNTTTLSNGPHTLQLWGHDTSNKATISAPVAITVAN